MREQTFQVDLGIERDIVEFFRTLDPKSKVAVSLASEIELLSGSTGNGLHRQIETAMGLDAADLKDQPQLLRLFAVGETIALAMRLQ